MQNVSPLNVGMPPDDRPFYIRVKDKFGEFDFGVKCVMSGGEVCTEPKRVPIHSELVLLGWREVPRESGTD